MHIHYDPFRFRKKASDALLAIALRLIDDNMVDEAIARVMKHYNPDAVCLVLEGSEHSHVKAARGMPTGILPFSSITHHVISRPLPVIICDAMADERFVNDSLVAGPPYARFYVGAPLIVAGACVGSLCLFDSCPRRECQLDECDFIMEEADALARHVQEAKIEAVRVSTIGCLPSAESVREPESEDEWSECGSCVDSASIGW